MKTEETQFRRNLFEIENARNLTRDEIVATFVPTKSFHRLLSAKNHIVLGARGSGKTVLARMLSHDYLSRCQDRVAREAVQAKAYLGLYVTTSIEWVGSLKNKPWQSEAEQEEFFQWRLNIAACRALLVSLKSCCDFYAPSPAASAMLEHDMSLVFSRDWSDGTHQSQTFRDLRSYLDEVEHQRQLAVLRRRAQVADERPMPGLEFETPLFSPLRRAIRKASDALGIPEEAAWLLCIDEAEFLEPLHQRVLNSHMRADSGNLNFKITTMPYAHQSLQTNTREPLSEGNDFEYVYIDRDPITHTTNDEAAELFANRLFRKRADVSGFRYSKLTLTDLLGPSVLLDDKSASWAAESTEMGLLRKHGSRETVARAERLHGTPEFRDQIARKVHGALLLKNAVGSIEGREELQLYAGARMVVRCGDGNPRRLIRICNALLQRRGNQRRVPAIVQNRVLATFSTSTLTRVRSEPTVGPHLHRFIEYIGHFMSVALHEQPVTTDQVSSIEVDEAVSDFHWELIKRAVGLGLLFPNISIKNPDHMPEREGVFHLAYVLAPHFRLLPRRGKSRKLSHLLVGAPSFEEAAAQPELFGESA